MNNDTTRLPGQRDFDDEQPPLPPFRSTAAAPPVRTTPRSAHRANGALPNIPGIGDNAAAQTARVTPSTSPRSARRRRASSVPTSSSAGNGKRVRTAQVETEEETAQAARQDPLRGFDWIGGIFDRLAAPRVSLRGGARTRPSPAKIAILSIGGLASWVWGGILTFLWLQETFPALKTSLTGNAFSLVATVAVSVLYLVIELWIWEGGHSWLTIICIIIPSLGSDIYMNVGGYKVLFGVKELVFWNDATAFLVIVGSLNALVPEKVLSAAWRTK
jgi:hypothetical protein